MEPWQKRKVSTGAREVAMRDVVRPNMCRHQLLHTRWRPFSLRNLDCLVDKVIEDALRYK